MFCHWTITEFMMNSPSIDFIVYRIVAVRGASCRHQFRIQREGRWAFLSCEKCIDNYKSRWRWDKPDQSYQRSLQEGTQASFGFYPSTLYMPVPEPQKHLEYAPVSIWYEKTNLAHSGIEYNVCQFRIYIYGFIKTRNNMIVTIICCVHIKQSRSIMTRRRCVTMVLNETNQFKWPRVKI